MRYVTAKEMKEIDSNAINQYGVPAAVLMENAGKAVAQEAIKMVKRGDIFVFSGYGNNGGDGFVAARHLIKNGYSVKVFIAGLPKPFSRETKANYDALLKLDCKPEPILNVDEMGTIFDNMQRPALVIDAVFGIGIRGALEDFYVKLIDSIDALGSQIIAVDIPSGLDANTGEPLGRAIKAARTVTLGFPKIGFKNPKARDYVGQLIVADIGLPRSLRKDKIYNR